MTYHAVLFDMDGTLLNTLEDIAEAANRVLRTKGFPVYSIGEYRFFVGEGARKLIERILPIERSNQDLIDACLRQFLSEYESSWHNRTQLYPGIADMLTALEDRSISKSILSNKPDVFTRKCADYYLSEWRFTQVVGNSETIPRKPDPEGALFIADKIGVKPGQCLFVGDSKIDMETATRAGMFPVGVLWGFRPRDELAAHGAKRFLEHPLDLLDLLDSSGSDLS